jgi:hypothetical protein
MAGGVPILCNDDLGELTGEPVDQRHNQVTFRYCQLAAGGEVVLNVDNQ